MAYANKKSKISQAHPDITVVVNVGALLIAQITNIIKEIISVIIKHVENTVFCLLIFVFLCFCTC